MILSSNSFFCVNISFINLSAWIKEPPDSEAEIKVKYLSLIEKELRFSAEEKEKPSDSFSNNAYNPWS